MSGRIRLRRLPPLRKLHIPALALARAVCLAALLALPGLLAGCEFTAPSATPTPHVQRLPMVVDNTQGENPPPYPAPLEGTSFAVEVRLEASAAEMQVGETLSLTAVTEDNSTGCQYPLYEISLQESEPGKFEFLSPQVIGPPGVSPATFEVRALESGVWELFAQAYGEKDCGEGWQWTYVTSQPVQITVNP